MLKVLGIILNVILTSLFMFPFNITGLYGNTKMYLAVAGLVVLGIELAKGRSASFDKGVLNLSLWALVVSFIGLVSIIINNTPDYAYASYIVSMWVWLSAAYFVVKMIQAVHGKITVELLCNYLITVCVFQCFMSILIDRYTGVRNIVDRYVQQGQDFLKNAVGVKRKYGIGASLDVAGSRFSAILVIASILLVKANENKKTWLALLYLLCFGFISVQGNAIARTTSVGMILGLGVMGLYFIYCLFKQSSNRGYAIPIGSILVVTVIAGATYLYNTDEQFHEDMRFGFEGFFSLAEKGEWAVSSNDRLRSMYVWPDNTKTWLIGDGYFSNPTNTDPYFIGEITGGYYKGTDAGYLRFIYYFGLIGLAAFSCFICYATKICIDHYPDYKWMFLLLMATNFIVWVKVSTDIFVIFAPFVAMSGIRTKPHQIGEVQEV